MGARMWTILVAGCALSAAACASPAPETAPVAITPATSATSAPPSTTATSPTTSRTSTTTQPEFTDWADIVQRSRGAVVRLEVSGCENRWVGTGFAVSPRQIVTAAHVADGAVSVGVQGDDLVTTAELIALDKDADVALLRSGAPLPTSLPLSTTHAPLGTSLALLGFPGAVADLRVTQGIVSGVDASVDYGPDEGISLRHVLATDAAINGGNSGGPAVDRSGRVIGLVTGKQMYDVNANAAEGTGFVVPSDQLLPRIDSWRSQSPAGVVGCDGERNTSADVEVRVSLRVDTVEAQDIARSLVTHGSAINAGEYEVAWAFFTDRERASVGSFDAWARGLSTSLWRELTIESADVAGDTAAVGVRLRTTQSAAHGPSGQECSLWSITYTMERSGPVWLIDKATSATDPLDCS